MSAKQKMRIAYLVNQYPKVSHSFIRREIQALERLGFEVVRMALRGWDADLVDRDDMTEREQTLYVLRDGAFALLLAAIRVLVLKPRVFIIALKLACKMGRRADRPMPIHLIYLAEACLIYQWLQTQRISHLHAHFGTNPAEIAMLASSLSGGPWSFTVHGPEEFDKPQFIGLSEKVRRCSFVVAISSYGRSQIYRWIEHEYWPKVHVVHCGLEAEFLERPLLPVPATRRLVCVGRLCEQKGHLLLIEAAHRLVSQGIEFELVLAGDGEMRPLIEAKLECYGLSNTVRVTGWISNARVIEEIVASRALVLPSFAEGLPVVIMEAMALGRPVIATYVAGIPELVKSGEDGWLFPAGDVGALRDAMQRCLSSSQDTITKMGKVARRRVAKRHFVDDEAKKLAVLFTGQPSPH